MVPSLRPRVVQVLVASLAWTVLAGVSACRLIAASVEGTLSASASGAKSLFVQNGNGSVEIIKDPTVTDLQVSAKVRCAADSKEAAEARLKATRLVAERDPDGRVVVQVIFPPRGSAAGTVMLGGSGEGASLVIRAANLDGMQVDTGNGSITCGGFAGLAKLGTSNGSIRIDGHEGPVHLDTSNGSIEATRVGTPLIAETSNGRVEVSLAESATGDVTIDTSNGRVELQLPAAWQGTVQADTSNGSIETFTPAVKVVKDGGEATLIMGDGTKARATIDTSNGRVTIRAATN
jgi:DUF4097 and DUF4098 domain-containing protein YvlB